MTPKGVVSKLTSTAKTGLKTSSGVLKSAGKTASKTTGTVKTGITALGSTAAAAGRAAAIAQAVVIGIGALLLLGGLALAGFLIYRLTTDKALETNAAIQSAQFGAIRDVGVEGARALPKVAENAGPLAMAAGLL